MKYVSEVRQIACPVRNAFVPYATDTFVHYAPRVDLWAKVFRLGK